MSDIIDIRAVKMEEAGQVLAPVLAELYVKYGLDLTTTLLMYYAAKGIMLSGELSMPVKYQKIEQARSDFRRAINVLDKDSIIT